MKNDQPNCFSNYVIIDSLVLRDSRLTSTDKIVYSLISGLSATDLNCCVATNNYMSSILNISRRTIQTSIIHLKKFGYVTVEIENGYKRKIKTSLNLSRDILIQKFNEWKERQESMQRPPAEKKELIDYDWLKGGL